MTVCKNRKRGNGISLCNLLLSWNLIAIDLRVTLNAISLRFPYLYVPVYHALQVEKCHNMSSNLDIPRWILLCFVCYCAMQEYVGLP